MVMIASHDDILAIMTQAPYLAHSSNGGVSMRYPDAVEAAAGMLQKEFCLMARGGDVSLYPASVQAIITPVEAAALTWGQTDVLRNLARRLDAIVDIAEAENLTLGEPPLGPIAPVTSKFEGLIRVAAHFAIAAAGLSAIATVLGADVVALPLLSAGMAGAMIAWAAQ